MDLGGVADFFVSQGLSADDQRLTQIASTIILSAFIGAICGPISSSSMFATPNVNDELLQAVFFLEMFYTLFVWRLSELSTSPPVVADMFRPIHAIHVLRLNLPPRPMNHAGPFNKFKGFSHTLTSVKYYGSSLAWLHLN